MASHSSMPITLGTAAMHTSPHVLVAAQHGRHALAARLPAAQVVVLRAGAKLAGQFVIHSCTCAWTYLHDLQQVQLMQQQLLLTCQTAQQAPPSSPTAYTRLRVRVVGDEHANGCHA